MPNHVTTMIRCDPKVIDQLISTVEENGQEYKTFDFNNIIPTPDNIFQGNLGLAEREIHGANNWYDWNSANWGTKWNAYDVTRISEDSFSFDTAWAHPIPIIEALALKYPDTEFEVAYADENIGYNLGLYIVKNDTISRRVYIDTPSWLAYEFASHLKRGEDYLVDEELEFMKERILSGELDEEDTAQYLEDIAEAEQENAEHAEQRNAFLLENPRFDFNDIFGYLNIGTDDNLHCFVLP